VGWDSAVGIVTRYRLGGPGIESRWGRDFPHLSRPALGPTQPTTQWVPGHFPRGKAVRAWHWSPPLSSAKIKERVELYLYSLSGTLWPVLGWTLPLLLPSNTITDSGNCMFWTHSRWQKLQRSEEENIAGNYFKPKRAVELLNRAKEDANRAFSTWKGKYLFGVSLCKLYAICMVIIFHTCKFIFFK